MAEFKAGDRVRIKPGNFPGPFDTNKPLVVVDVRETNDGETEVVAQRGNSSGGTTTLHFPPTAYEHIDEPPDEPRDSEVTHTFSATLPDGRTVRCPEPGEGWRCVGEPREGDAFVFGPCEAARSTWEEINNTAIFAEPPKLLDARRWERVPREHYAIRFPLLHEPAREGTPGKWPERHPGGQIKYRRGE